MIKILFFHTPFPVLLENCWFFVLLWVFWSKQTSSHSGRRHTQKPFMPCLLKICRFFVKTEVNPEQLQFVELPSVWEWCHHQAPPTPSRQHVCPWKSCPDVSLCCAFLLSVTKALGPKQFQLPFRPQDDLLARAMAQGPKTVDVPASLPTPPHNNQEELR